MEPRAIEELTVKQKLRNIFGLGGAGALCLMWSACSDGGGTPIGTAGSGTTGGSPPAVGGSSSAGTAAQTGGVAGTTPVIPQGGNAGTTATGGTGTAGTATGGTGTAGTATGGTAAGSTAAGGTATGGTGGGSSAFPSFPANCPAPSGTHSTMAAADSCWITVASDCAATAQNMNPPENALDGDAATRFSTGILMNATAHYTYQVDLGTATMINGVMVNSSVATDYAPGLKVSVSADGTTFTPVACGPGAVLTDFSFAPTSAKFVRLTQHGDANPHWWSIHELTIYRADGAADTCGGTAGTPLPATSECTTPHTQ